MSKLVYKELSDRVSGGVFKVHNALGPGLLESAYEGACVADMVVEGKIILELKSVKVLTPVMEAQLINYLQLSHLPVGYLLNFRNERVEWKRRVLGPGSVKS